MKDIYVVGEKMTRKCRKTAIYQSQILVISLYLPRNVAEKPKFQVWTYPHSNIAGCPEHRGCLRTEVHVQ